MIVNFKTPYKRPLKFTGKFSDFSPKVHKDILKLADEELNWWHYQVIFHFGCNAGTYQECCYFLPNALDYLTKDFDDSYEIISNILFFIASHHDKLQEDNIFIKCEEAILEILLVLLLEFDIVHFDINQCQDMGWNTENEYFVKNTDNVNEIIENLVKHDCLLSVVNNFMAQQFNQDCIAIYSLWFLELFRYLKVEGFGAKKNREIYWNWFINKKIIMLHFNKAKAVNNIKNLEKYLTKIGNITPE